MRLIDADSLLVNMDKGIQGTAREYLKFYQMAVNDEPTAYDVDKVVGKIEEYAHSGICKSHNGCPYRNNENMNCENCGAMGTLEIVKSGGIK